MNTKWLIKADDLTFCSMFKMSASNLTWFSQGLVLTTAKAADYNCIGHLNFYLAQPEPQSSAVKSLQPFYTPPLPLLLDLLFA